MKSQHVLSDIAEHVTHLSIACSRCDRSGRLLVARLVQEHGGEATIREAVAGVNADCPRLGETSIMGRCDVFFPGLAGILR